MAVTLCGDQGHLLLDFWSIRSWPRWWC